MNYFMFIYIIMATKKELVLQQMYTYAPKRASIPNANNGRSYMACLVLNEKYYLLRSRL